MIVSLNPVTIPPGYSISRELIVNPDYSDGKFFDDNLMSQYDNKTIFYDVFFNPDNQFLYAVGPPLLNLSKELSPIKLFVNKNEIKFSIFEDLTNRVAILNTESIQEIIKDENLVEIDFGRLFLWSCTIPNNTYISSAKLTLATMQKNNRIIWLRDWIKYYKKNFGIDRIILYDNNSSYQSMLEYELKDIIILKWNFKYGSAKHFIQNFPDYAYRNHCRLRFGNNNYGLYFDIDELLVLNNFNLLSLLHGKTVIYFDSYSVPFSKTINESYSFKDFHFRRKDNRIKSKKYIYKFNDVLVNNVHSCVTKSHMYLPGKYLLKLLDKVHTFILNISSRFLSIKPLLSFMIAPINFIYSLYGIYDVPLKEGYFLHYIGITTNWKYESGAKWNRLVNRKFSTKLHVKDMPYFEDKG